MPPVKRARTEEEEGTGAATNGSARSTGVPEGWALESWRARPIQQQPQYPDEAKLNTTVKKLTQLPPIVQAEEVDQLKAYLAEVAMGKRFILQGGDCAERFQDCHQDLIQSKIKILLQMSLVLVWGATVPLVRIGRIAGQYMKPRSKPMETVEGREVHSYKGDSINSFDNLDERVPDPSRLLDAYFHSAATMNYLRGLLVSGFADLHHPEEWDLSFVRCSSKRSEYTAVVERIQHALNFMQSCGLGSDPSMSKVDVFSSHEGLVLDFESAMTRHVPGKGYYNLGAHFVWIGDRTRQLDGAHVEYFRGIRNPVGCKVGPTTKPSELVELVQAINPTNEPGRITLITRFGAGNVKAMLPAVIKAVKEAGLIVVWECDPMHGNTKSVLGTKTREFDDILSELLATFDVHQEFGTWLGGIHFELTGENVTECTGGSTELAAEDLSRNYQSFCDPRLNCDQSLEMAFLVASKLAALKAGPSAAQQ